MAAPAYSRQYATAQPLPSRGPRPDRTGTRVRVVPGTRQVATPQAPSNAAFVAAVIALALVVFALLSFARVAISSATIATSIESQEITSQIETARSEGNQLEVNESILANPTSVKEKATKLGMASAWETGVISLEQDVVAFDADGSLSLTESIRRASSMA